MKSHDQPKPHVPKDVAQDISGRVQMNKSLNEKAGSQRCSEGLALPDAAPGPWHGRAEQEGQQRDQPSTFCSQNDIVQQVFRESRTY